MIWVWDKVPQTIEQVNENKTRTVETLFANTYLLDDGTVLQEHFDDMHDGNGFMSGPYRLTGGTLNTNEDAQRLISRAITLKAEELQRLESKIDSLQNESSGIQDTLTRLGDFGETQ